MNNVGVPNFTEVHKLEPFFLMKNTLLLRLLVLKEKQISDPFTHFSVELAHSVKKKGENIIHKLSFILKDIRNVSHNFYIKFY